MKDFFKRLGLAWKALITPDESTWKAVNDEAERRAKMFRDIKFEDKPKEKEA